MTTRLQALLRAAALAAGGCALAWAAWAQAPKASAATPSAQEIIERLARPPARADNAANAASAPAPNAPPSAAAATPADAAPGALRGPELRRNLVPVQRRMDLNIAFEFNSAVLRPEGQEALQQLASAMQSPQLLGTRFLLEGHTDAKGSAEYNERLSAQRARSVADFLNRQGVDAQRLQTVGKGFRELLTGEDPLSAAQRRVRIIALD